MGKGTIAIVCPGCKKELQEKDIRSQFTLGQDNTTISIDLQIYCDTCDAPSFFTFVKVVDMVNLKEVSNG